MPDPYERHSRSRWEWGSPGSRSQERAAAAQDDPAKTRTPGKKDPDLCKGQHWKGPHLGEVILVVPVFPRQGKTPECGWRIQSWRDESIYWSCYHEEHCRECGKVLRISLSRQECPLYREITPAERKVLEEELEASRERRAKWRVHRRPVIKGPQGYRKKRND